ncbi:trypsin-like serine protease [Amycolatopsis sp. NPDC059657]|uniref:trypsin-like serine protease n=1 Tax=Amycolatopsis sp. NPDC059657 TaxID=3346899 RepID=UPI00366B2F5D
MSREHPARFVAVLAILVTTGLTASPSAQALSNATPAPAGSYQFTAKISTETHSCSGALIDPSWIITAASCLPENPQGGTPAKPVAVTVGTHVVHGTTLIRRPDRDVMLARLDAPITDVAPIALGTTTPAAGQSLRVAGYGRTSTVWAPNQLHTASFAVSSTTATTVAATGENGSDTCKGDAGGPAFREVNGQAELVAISSTSWQHGCLTVSEARQGSTEVRTDDIKSWVQQQITALQPMTPAATATTTHRINLTWKPNAGQSYASYRVYGTTTADVPLTPATLLKTTTTPKYTHGPLGPKQTWYYRIVPVTAAGQDGPVSAVATATTKAVPVSDFTADGRDDIAAAYYYDEEDTGLLLWPAIQNAPGFEKFTSRWRTEGWKGANCRWLAADINADGRTDAAAFCGYPDEFSTRLFTWTATATGFADPAERWYSGENNFDVNRAQFVSGDFNGDGRTDVAAGYGYDGAESKLFMWYATADGFSGPEVKWASAVGEFDAGRAVFIAGDFNADGRADIAAAYGYDKAITGLFAWTSTADGLGPREQKWLSEENQLERTHASWFTGDFNADGRVDIGAAYDSGGANTSLLAWHSNGTGLDPKVERLKMPAGDIGVAQGKWTAGDFDGDGRTDVAVLYKFPNDRASIFTWHATAAGFDARVAGWESPEWDFATDVSALLRG